MGFARVAAIGLVAISAGCRTLPPPTAGDSAQFTAIGFDKTGESLWISSRFAGGCRLERLNVASRSVQPVAALDSCPDRIVAADHDELLLVRGAAAWFVDTAGRVTRRAKPLPQGARSPYVLNGELFAILASARGEAVAKITSDATVPLTPFFRAVDSFDVSPDHKEIVFSADAGKGFDVGLAATDGSAEVNWIFPDPLPERGVSWAPRGNKVTYRLESIGGTVLRTVHVPSSFQLAIDLPLTSVTALAWEPKAERFAMVLSSFNRPPWIDIIKYGGEDRQTLRGSEPAFEVEPDRAGGMYLLAPSVIRYNDSVPLVVWATDEPRFSWAATRGRLHKTNRIATAIGESAAVDAEFWEAVRALPWIDKSRIFVIYRKATPPGAVFPDGITVIAPSTGQRAGDTHRQGRYDTVTVAGSRSPEQVEAFAAEWIQRYLHARR